MRFFQMFASFSCCCQNAQQQKIKVIIFTILCFRTAHAQGKAEAAVAAAQKAQEESRIARVTAKQFSPSFQHPGNGGQPYMHWLKILYIAHVHIRLYRDPETKPSRQQYVSIHPDHTKHIKSCVCGKGQRQPPSSFAVLQLSLIPVERCR